MNVLISLHRGYGLGDCVQMSAVLRHVVKYRPEWVVDYRAEAGRHVVGRDIVANTFAYGDPYPHEHYDAEVQILLFDTWANWGDRPNTRVSSCLHERFGLPWDPECGRYVVNVSRDAWYAAHVAMSEMIAARPRIISKPVAIHYQGDSSKEKKNLSHVQAFEICEAVFKTGNVPLLLDWRNQSPLPLGNHRRRDPICTTGTHPKRLEWGNDAEMQCAIISHCSAFVGIDSGPSKCASATETPSLVVWTGHHPAPFHDPAPNTTHLVPRGYHGLYPVCEDRGVIEWFEAHYNVRTYDGDPVAEVGRWLKEILQ